MESQVRNLKMRSWLFYIFYLGILSCKSENHSNPSANPVLASTISQDNTTKVFENGPRLGSIVLTTSIFEKPSKISKKIGYLRAGGTISRAEKPASFEDCLDGFYAIWGGGYICSSNEATTDLTHSILRSLKKRPDLSKPMPYPYAFVRAIAPNYFRVPTQKEQFQYEMSLEKHLESHERMKDKWNALQVGANDVPLDSKGNAVGDPPDEPMEVSENLIFGGNGDDSIPWFFQNGRKIPNISSFKSPEYAVITNRIARHAGLALIDSFMGPGRRFAMTTDARLIPTSKLKPVTGSTFHGVDLQKGWNLPIAFVISKSGSMFEYTNNGLHKISNLIWHSPIQLNGKSMMRQDIRYVQAQSGFWIPAEEAAIAVKPSEIPSFAKTTEKWIDISILSQTMVLYEKTNPVYVTAISTGRDGLQDPKKTFSTVLGTFRIREKHVTTTMDAHEVDNKFELRDVPWVEYFEAGYAIHAALWHDDFGRPRSHGCVNVSPIDARRIFLWTEPKLPTDWHGVFSSSSTGQGTLVHIHP